MSNELAVIDAPLSVPQLQTHIRAIHDALKLCMKKDTHYGIIPGCKKPSLWKPGAELICSMFRIAAEYVVEDLSTPDCVRYRVRCIGRNMAGDALGEGLGECSSDEAKYRWRAAVCKEEFDETPPDRRREKWSHGKGGTAYRQKQVRTEPADEANTVLKMAEKRSHIGMVRTVTACSDVFLDPDSPPRAEGDDDDAPTRIPEPKATTTPAPDGNVITEKQRGRFYGKCKTAGITDEQAKAKLAEYGFKHSSEITRDKYDELCTWAEGCAERSGE